MSFNEEQKVAVSFKSNTDSIVNAGAGAGKSTSMIGRITKLIKEGTNPSSLFISTFTKSAAVEMTKRLAKSVGKEKADRVMIGTTHSLFYKLLKNCRKYRGENSNFSILMEYKKVRFFIDLIKNNDLFTKSPNTYITHISLLKNKDIDALAYSNEINQDSKFKGKTPKNCSEVAIAYGYLAYESYLRKNHYVDFDDMLFLTYRELKKDKNAKYLGILRDTIKYIMIDEAQDLNYLQYKLIELISGDNKNIMLILDDFQCQPSGTMIKMQGGGYKPIEDIVAGDKVVSLAKSNIVSVGGTRNGRNINEVSSRDYSGKLIGVNAGGKETFCTPNHKWVARFSNRSKSIYVVYMMRKGDNFRIGWCQLFHTKGANHFFHRCKLEGADAGWILAAYSDRGQASIHEAIISTKFGIATVMFKEVSGNLHYTQDALNFIFSKLGNGQISRAIKCLEYYNRDIKYPYYLPTESFGKKSGSRLGRTTIFEIHASNLLPEIMMVPVDTGTVQAKWEKIKITHKNYDGKVYSLDVEREKIYCADGIYTHNSIYGWRGSSINLLFDFMEQRKPQIINITRNYRCPPSVVESSNKLIKFNKKQIDKALVAEKDSDHKPVIIISDDPENEADNVINHIESVLMDGYEFSDICILYRTNAQSRALVDRFIMNEIPHTVKSEFSFYDRSDVKDIVAYLRIIVDPDNADPQDFTRILNKPLRYLPNTLISAVERLEDDLNAVNFLSAFKKYDQANVRLNWNQRKELDSLIKKISDLQIDYTYQKLSTPDLIIKIVQVFEYEKTLNDKKPLEGDEDGKLNIEAIISGAKMFPDPLKFLGFVDSQSAKKKKKVDKNSISLMTIHASKGMEFPIVIVIGFCSKIMPYYRSTSSEEIEEERRLAYVAVTRTQERLYLSTIYGKFGRMNVVPSNYVAEMGLKLPSVIMKYGE
jgi:DNA helicase II / ATP-dependent DNA helicase PcrA